MHNYEGQLKNCTNLWPLTADTLEEMLRDAIAHTSMLSVQSERRRCASSIRSFEAELGELIRQKRRDRGWFQRDLGQKIGYTQQMISVVESGKVTIDAKVLFALAEVFGCELREFDVRRKRARE